MHAIRTQRLENWLGSCAVTFITNSRGLMYVSDFFLRFSYRSDVRRTRLQ